MRKMKDSGVEWIGEIPENWKVGRIKYNYYLKGRIGWQGLKADEFIEEGPFLVTGTDFKNGKVNWETCYHISEERYLEAPEIHVRVGDLLITKDGTVGKVAYIDEKPKKVSLNSHLLIMRPLNNQYNNRFLFWVIQSPVFDKYFLLSQNGTIMASLSQEKINDFSFALPSPESQKRIADYLDKKCTKIDAIIVHQEEIVEKLKEYKLSIITEAVTKGLNADVKLKNSGVDRIGLVPCSWKVTKVTRILDNDSPYPIGDGDHGLIKTENYKEKGIPYIRVQNLGWGTELLLDNVIYISPEDNERIKNSELHPDDILFCKTGATIGKTGIVPEYMPVSNTTSHVGKITVDKKYNSRFVFYFLSSFVGYMQFWDIACMKSTRPELSIEETKGIQVVIPDTREEQDYIVNYLDKKTRDINTNILKKQNVVEKLKEYKKALIYEVVTGKKEV